jgi:hypothetical protein
MAAPCNGGVAAACSDSDDHIRQVALTVAVKKVEAESNVYTLRRPDYTAEEWRFLYVTTGTDYYLNSIRLVGFCGVDGINWAVVTRMKEIDNPARESFHGTFPKECLPILHYMRPQFRFLIYFGRDNVRVNLEGELDRFFDDAEKVVSGDASVWGAPVVVDGVHILRQEFFARTSDLDLPAGQHYVFPGVRSPLLLPTDYIRKYSSIYIYYLFSFYCVCGSV